MRRWAILALWKALAALCLPLVAAQPDPAVLIASLIDPAKLASRCDIRCA